MSGLDSLIAVFDELEERARHDPRLDQYRIDGMGRVALNEVPSGWYLSECVEHLVVNGGWWPGHHGWLPRLAEEDQGPIKLGGIDLSTEAVSRRTVRWAHVGNVWEKDHFSTPLLRRRTESAPLFGWSSQALWCSMIFPHEAAILEAFIATYDELGFDDDPDLFHVHPMFVEWVTQPPPGGDAGETRVHERLAELSAGWETDHPCWCPDAMPSMQDDSHFWTLPVQATILGIDQHD